ncbi:MAG: heavy metal translocating P-type ATPase [Saprospiraceae bacterium]
MTLTTTLAPQKKNDPKQHCYHCGQEAEQEVIVHDDKAFCCQGCLTVYDILSSNQMGQYYCLNENPGISKRESTPAEYFGFLDDPNVRAQLIVFSDTTRTRAVFQIPLIHCSSCIWLLEALYKLHPGVIKSQVNFMKREATIDFDEEKITLRELVELLSRVGYEPEFNFASLNQKAVSNPMKAYYMKLGVAFFCFGNIMLASFPEYLGLDGSLEAENHQLFGYLNLGLSLPVLLFSSQDFFKSAYNGLRQRFLNIDVPIVLGILVMFFRSAYEVITQTGAGYFDTMASLVFLMLIGRMFQNKSYSRISFEHDYKSYFPISAMKLVAGNWQSLPVSAVKTGDRLLIRNMELIPADSILIKGEANIDYSFVTGEQTPVVHENGAMIFAGGRQMGSVLEVEVVKPVSQSYLTQLWNSDIFNTKSSKDVTALANHISHYYFTPIILLISFAALGYWMYYDPSKALPAFTAVLIITCPCALALSSPFTLGNIVRILGKNGFYLKNANVVERIQQTDALVFDKTGTLTKPDAAKVEFVGDELSTEEKMLVKSLSRHSVHPLSRRIFDAFEDSALCKTESYDEQSGSGISGVVNGSTLKLGSEKMVLSTAVHQHVQGESCVFLSINGQYRGMFSIKTAYREGFASLLNNLKSRFELYLLSGDNESEKENLLHYFDETSKMRFKQSPGDKLEFIRKLKEDGRHPMMIGDGLNDAGALQEASVGVAISENINHFSPACDAILDARKFENLDKFLRLARAGVKVMKLSFVISFCYNIFGIYFAVQGTMSPLFAAVIMPISSVTVILFTTLASNVVGRSIGFDD